MIIGENDEEENRTINGIEEIRNHREEDHIFSANAGFLYGSKATSVLMGNIECARKYILLRQSLILHTRIQQRRLSESTDSGGT